MRRTRSCPSRVARGASPIDCRNFHLDQSPGPSQLCHTDRSPRRIRSVHELIFDLHEGRPVLLQLDVIGRHLHDVGKAESGSREHCSHALKGVSELDLDGRRHGAICADANAARAAEMITVANGGRVVPAVVDFSRFTSMYVYTDRVICDTLRSRF
jgi:hypothetical protein